MFKSKKLVALGLAAVALFSTVGVSLAYWASSVSGSTANATGTVNVGSGKVVTTTVSTADATAGKALVPAGFVTDADTETATADIVFTVSWETTGDDGAGATKTLTVAQVSKVAKNSANADVTASVGSLYNVTYPSSVSIVADDPALTVHVTVTLTEPTLAQYASVAGGSLVLTISFTVA